MNKNYLCHGRDGLLLYVCSGSVRKPFEAVLFGLISLIREHKLTPINQTRP